MEIVVKVASKEDESFAEAICKMIEEAAKARGTGIAKRKASYIQKKIQAENAVIALVDGKLAGFCYIETWEHGRYVANSGLIVNPEFRKMGLAKKIKKRAFELSKEKFPNSKMFGITTSLAVMKINADLGYKPVTFSELTQDEVFWSGCSSCPNYDILTRNDRKLCLCTGMLYKPGEEDKKEQENKDKEVELKQRWERYKEHLRKRNSNKILQRIWDNLFKKESAPKK
ncbi:MAG: GNAT family N-acetyltransferase [Bacteroidia bacterium]|nr:GNAT family N-acetyltransferase [Bacteroidia bacterium]